MTPDTPDLTLEDVKALAEDTENESESFWVTKTWMRKLIAIALTHLEAREGDIGKTFVLRAKTLLAEGNPVNVHWTDSAKNFIHDATATLTAQAAEIKRLRESAKPSQETSTMSDLVERLTEQSRAIRKGCSKFVPGKLIEERAIDELQRLKVERDEAVELLYSTPRLTINEAAAHLNGDDQALQYAKMLKAHQPRVTAFLSRTKGTEHG